MRKITHADPAHPMHKCWEMGLSDGGEFNPRYAPPLGEEAELAYKTGWEVATECMTAYADFMNHM